MTTNRQIHNSRPQTISYPMPIDVHCVLSPVKDPDLDPINPALFGQSMSLIQAERAPPSGPQFSGRVIQVKGLRSPRSTHWFKVRSVFIAFPIYNDQYIFQKNQTSATVFHSKKCRRLRYLSWHYAGCNSIIVKC